MSLLLLRIYESQTICTCIVMLAKENIGHL